MSTPNAPPDPAVERFRGDLNAVGGATGTIVVAVSGGSDSLALLALAAAAIPGRVLACTVDHALRSASASEAEQVEAMCHALNVHHVTARVQVNPHGNLSDQARAARYTALDTVRVQHGAQWIATAHHADDQRETIVMRLNRGAGIGGLAGIRRRNRCVLRPLLGWTRAELAEVVAAAGLNPLDDATNRDVRFDRARLRIALQDVDWLDARAVARSARYCDEAAEALDWAAARIEPSAAVMADLPDELVRRVLLHQICRVNPNADPGMAQLARLAVIVQRGRTGMLADVVCTPGPVWTFALAPPRRAAAIPPARP